MKRRVLLDEHLPIAMRHWLPAVDAFTVEFCGWKGLTNAALPTAARGRIDVLLTFDRALLHEQTDWPSICGVVLLAGRNDKRSLQLAAAVIEAACLRVEIGRSLIVQIRGDARSPIT